MKEKPPAFLLYVKDLICDDFAADLPNEQFAIYVKLLCHDWVNDGIKNLTAAIRGRGNYDPIDVQGNVRPENDFLNIVAVMQNAFGDHPKKPGYITNSRLIKERKKQDKNRKQRAKAGRASAKKRDRKRKLKVM